MNTSTSVQQQMIQNPAPAGMQIVEDKSVPEGYEKSPESGVYVDTRKNTLLTTHRPISVYDGFDVIVEELHKNYNVYCIFLGTKFDSRPLWTLPELLTPPSKVIFGTPYKVDPSKLACPPEKFFEGKLFIPFTCAPEWISNGHYLVGELDGQPDTVIHDSAIVSLSSD